MALYAAELDRAQEQMVQEFRSLQEEKELAVSEAFERAQEEMRAVHQSLDGEYVLIANPISHSQ